MPTSSREFLHQQHQQLYLQTQFYHHFPSLDSVVPIGASKEKKSERYYIYGHTRSPLTKDDEERNEKNRKARSSTLDRKQVSRNISLVLENLLMNYEKSQLPGEVIDF